MRPLTNHERRDLTEAQRKALSNLNPAARLAELQNPEIGGFTVSAHTGKKATSGISVALEGHELQRKTESLTKEAIAAWGSHPDRLATITGNDRIHFGGWAEQRGNTYLDLSEVHTDDPAGHLSARRAMVDAKQLAAYDLARGVEYTNPTHPGNLRLPSGEDSAMSKQVRPTSQSVRDYVTDTRPLGNSPSVTVFEPKDAAMRRGFDPVSTAPSTKKPQRGKGRITAVRDGRSFT